jgi:hypothetical protein
MWQQKIAQTMGFWAFAAAMVFSAAVLAAPAKAGFPMIVAAADEPAGDDADTVEPRNGTPGTAERYRGPDEPSEDGTEESPVAPAPDGPPGCTFRNGPLELVV